MNLVKFCDHYRQIGADIAEISAWFLWAALAVAAAVAIAEIVAKLRPPAAHAAAPGAGGAVVPLIDAIKGLITALSAAPLWIALFAVGLLTFAVPGIAVPASCTDKPKTEIDAGGGKAPRTKPSPASTATPTTAAIATPE